MTHATLLRAAARRTIRSDRPSAMRRARETRNQLAHLRAIRHEIPGYAYRHRWFVAVTNRRFVRLDMHTEMQRMTAHRIGAAK